MLTHQVDLRIACKNIENELEYCDYKYIHQGVYIIGIKGMKNKEIRSEGTNNPIRQKMGICRQNNIRIFRRRHERKYIHNLYSPGLNDACKKNY